MLMYFYLRVLYSRKGNSWLKLLLYNIFKHKRQCNTSLLNPCKLPPTSRAFNITLCIPCNGPMPHAWVGPSMLYPTFPLCICIEEFMQVCLHGIDRHMPGMLYNDWCHRKLQEQGWPDCACCESLKFKHKIYGTIKVLSNFAPNKIWQ